MKPLHVYASASILACVSLLWPCLVVAQVPAPAPPAPASAEAEPPATLRVGTEGFFQPGVLLQGWLQVDRAEETAATFRLRRAELSAKGEILPKLVSYALMVDFAKVFEPQDTSVSVVDDMGAATGDTVVVKQAPKKTAVSALQDFFITFQSAYVDASLGQFKVPVSYEGYGSSSKLLFAERGETAREFGDKRDIGVRLAKSFEYVGYSAGFFNGAGQNNLDTNDGKDGAARLELYPFKGFTVAGVAYATLWDRDDVGRKDRLEGDLHYEGQGFTVNVELIDARDRKSSGMVHGRGVSAALGYLLLDEVLQPVVRLDYLDPNTDVDVDPTMDKDAKDEVVRVDVGVNYYLRKHEAKLLLNYSRFAYDDKKPNNQIIGAAQVAF